MSVLTSIFGGGLGQLVKDVVGTLKLSPAAKQEFELALATQAHEIALKQMELDAKVSEYQAREIETASANIRAEASSGDKYTSRSRPTFLYICYAILINNYIVFPWSGRFPIEFPEPLFWLMGVCITGYVASRGWEKVMVKGRK